MIKWIKENSYNIFRLFLSQVALAVFGLIMTMWTSRLGDRVFLTAGFFCIFFYVYLIYVIVHDIGERDKPAVDAGRAAPHYLKGLWLGISANILNIICGIMVFVFGFSLVYQQPVTVYNESGEEVKLYLKNADTGELAELAGLYSDTGDDVYTYDHENYTREVTLKVGTASAASGSTNGTVIPCDADGNDLILRSRSGDPVGIAQGTVKNWASNLYGIPMIIATFTQSMYKAVHVTLFGNADWFYLIMPLPTILASALAYYLGLKGKRILFFLPERKSKKPDTRRF